MRATRLRNACLAAAVAVLAFAPAVTAKAPRSCDHACLTAIIGQWLDALPKHSAAGLPLAKTLRFTEQAAAIPIGDGLFLSTTEGPSTFRIVAADPVSGQVAAFAMMKQWDKPVLVAVRLKIADRKIIEAEHVIATTFFPGGLENLKTPRQALLDDVPAAERTPRAQMWAAANAYFDSIEQDDGSIAPFADDCTRHENGGQTTTNAKPVPPPAGFGTPQTADAVAHMNTLNCRDQLNTHVLQYITMIRPRMLLVIDEQKGLVFGFPRFVHRGDNRLMKIAGVAGLDVLPMDFGPVDLQAAELFKIRAGKIHEIEANGFLNAYRAPTGWEDRYSETYKYAVTHPNTHPYRAGTKYP